MLFTSSSKPIFNRVEMIFLIIGSVILCFVLVHFSEAFYLHKWVGMAEILTSFIGTILVAFSVGSGIGNPSENIGPVAIWRSLKCFKVGVIFIIFSLIFSLSSEVVRILHNG